MNDPIIEAIGMIAAFFTTFAYLPQSIKTIKTKHTKDLSLNMVIMLELGLVCWLIYGIFHISLPIIFANSLSLILMTFILIQKIKYG